MACDTPDPESPDDAPLPTTPAQPGTAAQARREREAAALRQNLLRRKQHARSRAEPIGEPPAEP